MICPFFREECFKDNCVAYELKDRLGKMKVFKGELIQELIQNQPYCNALNCHLPISIEKNDECAAHFWEEE